VVRHVTEVAKGVHRLTNGVSNFYLIEESGKLVLVDAGAPKDWALFTRAVLGLGKAAGDLDAVLLTHAHTDHTGFAELDGIKADTLLPGHGEPWTTGVGEAIRQARVAGPS
jgi:glyoxylase-like metal-dependent hydrolase (beta-lactamase superfamily II)